RSRDDAVADIERLVRFAPVERAYPRGPHSFVTYRRIRTMRRIAGSTMTRPATNLNASGDVDSDAKTCAGNVRIRTVRIDAAKTSFHEMTNVKIAAAASPGSAGGSAIRTNAPQRLEPSVSAASSSSRETATNTPPTMRITNGIAIAAWTSATPMMLSYRPSWTSVAARGIARIAIGNIFATRTTAWNV